MGRPKATYAVVPYLVTLPVDLAQRMEEELHRVRLQELPHGRRGNVTAVVLFREAMELLLRQRSA